MFYQNCYLLEQQASDLSCGPFILQKKHIRKLYISCAKYLKNFEKHNTSLLSISHWEIVHKYQLKTYTCYSFPVKYSWCLFPLITNHFRKKIYSFWLSWNKPFCITGCSCNPQKLNLNIKSHVLRDRPFRSKRWYMPSQTCSFLNSFIVSNNPLSFLYLLTEL